MRRLIRRVEEMRRSIDAVRQGRAETVPLAGGGSRAAAAGPSSAAAAAAADRGPAGQRQSGQPGSDDDVVASWAAWEESRCRAACLPALPRHSL